MKLNPTGTLNWVRTQGGEDYDGMRDVALAPAGGVYSVGYFERDADLDPTSAVEMFKAKPRDGDSEAVATDLFFNRFDSNGNRLWTKPLAGAGYELVADASSDSSGNLLLTGSYYGTADFDPSKRRRILSTPSAGIKDANQRDSRNAYSGYIAKYSPNAKLLDVATIDGTSQQDAFINASALDATGKVFTGGRGRFGLDFGELNVSLGPVGDTREDGFAAIFSSALEPIL